jgi:lipid-binding SYLF domain-containing protein
MRHLLRIEARFLILILATVASLSLRPAYAAPAQVVDEDAQAALKALYASSPGAKALGAKARAILVFPSIHKAAFIVGAQSGDGVLFKDGSSIGHYRVDGLLAGLEAGAQSFGYAMFFMSDAALEKMKTAKGFEIGADPNIVIVDAGAAKEISTSTAQADIYGYVFNQKGLMGGIALQGSKITRVDR